MKRLLIGLALLTLLSGCATTGGVSPEGLTENAKKIQAYTKTICRFVPTVATIANIFASGVADISKIAEDICAAVTSAPLADGPRSDLRNVAQVRGVVIGGRFVR